MIKKNTYSFGLFFVLSVSVLLSFAFSPLYGLSLNDIEFFQYCGTAILRGQVPYRDFFDHKPPLIYFINAAGLLMGLGSWGLWIINTGLSLLITFLLFRLGREHRLRFPWLIPLLFNLMIRDFLVNGDMNFTREYSTFFVVLFFCILMGNSRYRLFLLGLFTALTFFTQQDQVLQLAPFLLYVLLTEERASILPKLTRLAAGFLTPTVLLVLYFAIHNSLSYFLQDAFLFNFQVYTREPKSWGDHFRSIKHILDAGNYEIPFMVSLALGITSLFLSHRKKGLVIAAIAALLLCLSSEYMGGRMQGTGAFLDIREYFLPLSGTVCILLFVVLAFTEDPMISDWRAQLPYALLLCCSLSYTALQHLTHLHPKAKEPEWNTPELPYLRQQNLKDYQFYTLLDGNFIIYYRRLNIFSPSHWLYHGFWQWYPNWDPNGKMMGSITNDLLRHKTTYVILEQEQLAKMKNPAIRDSLIAFVRAHYEQVTVPGRASSILWKWKDTPANAPDSTR